MERPLALIVDLEPGVRREICRVLAETGLDTLEAGSGPEAVECLRIRPVEAMLADLDAPDVAMTELFARAVRLRPGLISVAMTTNVVAALEALPTAVFDILEKPVEAQMVRFLAERILERLRLRRELVSLREKIRTRAGYRSLVGRSAVMERLRERLERQAELATPLLFVGEEGTGRELAARTVHALSARADRPFAALDCASLPETVLESELFGHERGAYLGAERRSVGLLERIEGGSLFLDEVTEMPASVQEKFARALEEGRFRRIDGVAGFPLDVRVFSASSRDVERAVQEERFRKDLYERLSAGIVLMPALRDRREDVPLLARRFIDSVCEINDIRPLRISPEALEAMERYGWPGNVRELRNAVEQAVILATDQIIRLRDLPEAVRRATSDSSFPSAVPADRPFRAAKREVVDSFERGYLQDLLERHGGNVTAAAQQAGMLRSALQRLLRKHDIQSASFRRPRREEATDEPS